MSRLLGPRFVKAHLRLVVEQSYLHTKIPIREVTQEAPIVHQSQTHAPIPLEQFVDRGGVLTGGVPQDQIAKKVLVGGECTREVEGIAGDLERDLNLGAQKREFPASFWWDAHPS